MQWLIDIAIEAMKLYLKGMIVLWSGTLDNIPEGWALCDGSNGTPNLKNYFIRQASPTLLPGSTGGSSVHQHTVDSHRHTLDIEADGVAGEEGLLIGDDKTGYESPGTSFEGTLPPYYALAYIMKL